MEAAEEKDPNHTRWATEPHIKEKLSPQQQKWDPFNLETTIAIQTPRHAPLSSTNSRPRKIQQTQMRKPESQNPNKGIIKQVRQINEKQNFLAEKKYPQKLRREE